MNLRYNALSQMRCSRDVVEDVERVARGLLQDGRWEGQLVSTIMHALRVAMIDLVPRGMYIECEVDWGVGPAMWRFWFEKRGSPRRHGVHGEDAERKSEQERRVR